MLPWLEIEPIKGALEPSRLLGRSPPFNLPAFKKQLETALEVSVSEFSCEWSSLSLQKSREHQPIDARRFVFTLSPLQGIAEIFIPNYQLDCIARHYFENKTALAASVEEAFIDYWIAMTASCLLHNEPLSSFQATAIEKSSKITSEQVVQGLVCLKCSAFEISAQILLDNTLHQSWLRHWSKHPFLGIERARASSTQLNLHMSIGSFELSPDELLSLNVGDWVHLESLGIDEHIASNQVTLMLGKQKVAKGHLQNDAVLIQKRDDFFDRLSIS